MRHVDVAREREQTEFAQSAAKTFAEEGGLRIVGNIAPGHFLALRWGLSDDSVLVVKLDEEHEPTIYGQLVAQYREEEG